MATQTSEKTTKTPKAKKAPKGAPKAKKAPKGAPKAKPVGEVEIGLRKSVARVLEVLAKAPPSGLTRHELTEKTGINKGWSKLLGAPSKGRADGMEGDGLVKSNTVEDHQGAGHNDVRVVPRGLVYVLTAKGRKTLSNAK